MSIVGRFSVVRVPFPFTDRQVQKRRPALVLSQPGFQQACVVRLKLFTLDEHLVVSNLGALAVGDRAGVAAQLAKLLPPGT